MNKILKKRSQNRERVTFDSDFRIIRKGLKSGYDGFLASGYDVESITPGLTTRQIIYEIITFLESIKN